MGSYYDIEPDMIEIIFPGGESRIISVGDEGCFFTTQNTYGNDDYRCGLFADKEGFPGNSDHSMKSLHGWRGTTNDRACYVEGWRRVENIEPRKRGVGFVVILSKDLSDSI